MGFNSILSFQRKKFIHNEELKHNNKYTHICYEIKQPLLCFSGAGAP
jgi:hypothetical protein